MAGRGVRWPLSSHPAVTGGNLSLRGAAVRVRCEAGHGVRWPLWSHPAVPGGNPTLRGTTSDDRCEAARPSPLQIPAFT